MTALKENAFWNFYHQQEDGSTDCLANAKIGFQSFNSDVAALQKGLHNSKELAEGGAFEDGDTILVLARFSSSDAATNGKIRSVTMADGTVRKIEPAVTEEEGEEEIPF